MTRRFTSALTSAFVITTALLFSTAARPKSFEDRERARLRSHFDSVLVELETRDVSALNASQRAARRTHIARLREYRDAGVFPKNLVSREATPVFVDPFGTHCAMGHLIAKDGRTDIVQRIANTRNLARIPELADDASLIAWLDGAGLTVAEAARIQPGYDWREGGTDDGTAAQRWTTSSRGYKVSTFVHGGVATALTTANLMRPGNMALSIASVVAGSAGIGLAASHLSNADAPRSYAAANGIMAAATIASAWRSARIVNSSHAVPPSPGDATAPSRVAAVVSPSALGLSVRF